MSSLNNSRLEKQVLGEHNSHLSARNTPLRNGWSQGMSSYKHRDYSHSVYYLKYMTQLKQFT